VCRQVDSNMVIAPFWSGGHFCRGRRPVSETHKPGHRRMSSEPWQILRLYSLQSNRRNFRLEAVLRRICRASAKSKSYNGHGQGAPLPLYVLGTKVPTGNPPRVPVPVPSVSQIRWLIVTANLLIIYYYPTSGENHCANLNLPFQAA
jgi:hypothetical protein